eukprot:3509335-Pleurochrysis_carterae.AAC.1
MAAGYRKGHAGREGRLHRGGAEKARIQESEANSDQQVLAAARSEVTGTSDGAPDKHALRTTCELRPHLSEADAPQQELQARLAVACAACIQFCTF